MHAMTVDQATESGNVSIKHHFDRAGGSAYAKLTHIKSGMTLGQHAHPHDHTSYLLCGRARVEIEGRKPLDIEGFEVLTIRGGLKHGVTALSDVVWVCAWNVKDTDPATVDATILKG